jgi:ubiquinol-cytochrome c reductase cytochrome c1 subunit
MMKIIFNIIAVIILSCANCFASSQELPKQEIWPFDGVFGRFDKQAIQRGFQVYKEICSVCHSLSLVSYRNLEEVGFSKDEVASLAAEYQVTDGPNDKGEMFQRPGKPFDHFVSPFPNEEAARAANDGAYPPDLSLIIKARQDGANYVHAILNGYDHKVPDDFKLTDGTYYNPYFPGMQIKMPQPLSDSMVTYQDGTAATIEQMSEDVVNFLQWAAEPEMGARKTMGLKAIIYLLILTVLFYVAKSHVWAKIDKKVK